jgi:hypothetical protein
VNKLLKTSSSKKLLQRQLIQARREVAQSLNPYGMGKKIVRISDPDKASEQIAVFQGKFNEME